MTTSWPLAKLGDHVDLLAGFAFKSREFTEDTDDVRLLRGANIGQGQLKWEQEKRWPRSRIAVHERFELAVDDIVVAMDRPWIEAGLKWSAVREPDLPALLVQRVARLRATGSLSQDFLRYLIGSPQFEAYVRPIVTGVNVPHISPSQIRDFSFHLPPRQFQDAVTGLLRPVDDLIENNRRRIEILEEMARLLYREWFVYFRFPGHEDVGLVDSDLGPIPEGWEVSLLGEACSLVMGQSPKSEYYNDIGEGLPFHQGVTDFGPRFPTHTKWTTVDKRVAEPGDILFSVRAPVGRINVASDRLVVGRGLSAIRAMDGNQNFLLTQLKEKFAVEDSIGGGTIFNAVTKKDMESIQLLKPISRVVEGFESSAGPMADLIANLSRQNLILREARDLLLPRLVSGELDVSELDMGLEAAGA